MKDNRFANEGSLGKKKELFDRTVNFTLKTLYSQKQVAKLNGATFEAVLHGVSKNIESLEVLTAKSKENITFARYENLLKQKAFSTETLSEGLYQKQKVVERFSLAESIFDTSKGI